MTAYKLRFEELCHALQIGDVIGVPETISGGHMHRMYAVRTTQGKYAVKALNPQIMLRPTAMQNYINSERIAGLAANRIPALSAKEVNGAFIHQLEGQYYLIFDWIDGRSMTSNEIEAIHCGEMGAILAEIHRTDFSQLGVTKEPLGHTPLTDWNGYWRIGEQNNAVWADLLNEQLDQLHEWTRMVRESSQLLAAHQVISHRDLEPKNVMWRQARPVVIDWESAGYINPMQDLIETAIYWSTTEDGGVDHEKFLAFVEGYQSVYGTLHANWRMVFVNGLSGRLDWLEYSLKRSLWIECTDEAEQQMGTSQVTDTINSIVTYANMIPELEKWILGEAGS